ncbi:MAG: GH3 auxin-responsive promoter family protein [Synergistaceae bacterium]|jgi:hypothetical protein|nr:GH3 auxin-responsive promoter family protein [Synergistaceae bacterium]
MRASWEKLIAAARSVELKCAGAPPWLHACLKRNAATKYGRAYDFENIRDEDDYRERVPLVTYDDRVEKIPLDEPTNLAAMSVEIFAARRNPASRRRGSDR